MGVFLAVMTGAWVGLPAAGHSATAAAQPQVAVRDFALIDATQGWLWAGDTVYWTDDAGNAWRPIPLPDAAPGVSLAAVHFASAETGWLMLLDAAGQGVLTATPDRGANWHTQPLPVAITAQLQTAGPLRLTSTGAQHDTALWLTAQLPGSSNFRRSVAWRSLDGGATWVGATPPAGLAEPSPALRRPDGSVLVRAATPAVAWALVQPAGALLRTVDGGVTWLPLSLPPNVAGIAAAQALPSPQAAIVGPYLSVVQGAGFDACTLPSAADLATWADASPYRSVNLYIGGAARFCPDQWFDAAGLRQLSNQGWTFIPTWVGPQAPCSEYRIKFSSDPGTAFAQGRAEADAAVAVARDLGLTEADGSGTVIYYDLESFTPDGPGCLDATRAFVAGWTARLQAAGNKAGLYGTACNPRLDSFANIDPAPDAIWVAQWNRNGFDPAMTVWNVACLDNSLWSQGQRIRQYTGGHDETWGGVTLEIDSSVLDGLVADLRRTGVEPTPTPTPTPQPPIVLSGPSQLAPPYSGGMCGSGWHMQVNEFGDPAFYAANRQAGGTIPPPATPLAAEWQAIAPVSGFYYVEAYVPATGPLTWQCPMTELKELSATARYTVQHADGASEQQASQAAAEGDWLPLGVFRFQAGSSAVVRLDTTTAAPEYTEAVAASALRLTLIDASFPPKVRLYLPSMRR